MISVFRNYYLYVIGTASITVKGTVLPLVLEVLEFDCGILQAQKVIKFTVNVVERTM